MPACNAQPTTAAVADDPDAPIELITVEGQAQYDVDEKIALADAETRRTLVRWMLFFFGGTNAFVMLLLGIVFYHEYWLIIDPARNYAAFQIVTKDVIMTLIAATAAQVGAIMLAISAYFFPRKGSG